MVGFTKPLWSTAAVLSLILSTSLAVPESPFNLAHHHAHYSSIDNALPSLEVAAEKRDDRVELRIMPFGASIMSGVGSSTKDGCVPLS